MNLGEIAKIVNGNIMGDSAHNVYRLSPLDKASSDSISFLATDKLAHHLNSSQAGAVMLSAKHEGLFLGNKIIVDDPYLSYARLSGYFQDILDRPSSIHPSAIIADTANVHESAFIGANVVVGDNVIIGENTRIFPGCYIGCGAKIGSDCFLHPNVTIYHCSILGNSVLIHSGTVIGSDGFGFAPSKDVTGQQKWVKIHQLGCVVIGDHVEIGAGTCIDRGAIENTYIDSNVIIDNQVHIAHNVRIGEGSAIAGCVGIAGSTSIGKNCTVAGAVAINGHIEIADNCHFNGGSIITKSTEANTVYASTTPMQEVKKWRRNSVRYTQLDDMHNRIRALEKQLND